MSGSLTGTKHYQLVRTLHVIVTTAAADLVAEKKIPRDVLIQNNDATGTIYLSLTGDAMMSLRFTSGGTTAIVVGNTITGETGGATAVVVAIDLDSGSWAGGDAAGVLSIDTISGTFQSETLKVGANLNLATITADAYSKGMFRVLPGGSFQMNNLRNAISALGNIASNENVAVSEGR